MQTCRRRQRRYAFPPGENASVEFGYPSPSGHLCRLRLADVSASGLGFVVEYELPGLAFGSTIRSATLHLRGRKIELDLLVVHISRVFAAGGVCGCLFYPASDTDLLRLKIALAEIEAQEFARVGGRVRVRT